MFYYQVHPHFSGLSYFVFEDTLNATKVKIHSEKCGFVKREPTETTLWHECDTLSNAEQKAKEIAEKYDKGWKLAECCFS